MPSATVSVATVLSGTVVARERRAGRGGEAPVLTSRHQTSPRPWGALALQASAALATAGEGAGSVPMFRPAPTTARVRQSVGGEESLPQQGEEVPSATVPVATALSETVAARERRAGRRGEAGRRDPPLWVHWHNTPSTVAPGASARLVGTPSVSLRVRRPRGGAGGAVRARSESAPLVSASSGPERKAGGARGAGVVPMATRGAVELVLPCPSRTRIGVVRAASLGGGGGRLGSGPSDPGSGNTGICDAGIWDAGSVVR